MDKQTLIYRIDLGFLEGELATLFARYGSVYDIKLRLAASDKEMFGWGYVTLDKTGASRVVDAFGQADERSLSSTKTTKTSQKLEVWLPCVSCVYKDFCVSVLQDDTYPFSCSSYNASQVKSK